MILARRNRASARWLGAAMSVIRIEGGRIAEVTAGAAGGTAHGVPVACAGQPALPHLPARDGRDDRGRGRRGRTVSGPGATLMYRFLDRLTPEDVRGDCRAGDGRDGRGGLCGGGGVSLPAPPGGRRHLCRPGRDVGADRGGGGGDRAGPDASAGDL